MWSIPPTPFVPTCYYPPPVIACPPQPCKPSISCCPPPPRPCHPCCGGGGCCGPKQIVYIPIPQPKKKKKGVGAKKPSRPCPGPTLNDNQSEYNNCNFFMSQLPQELMKRFGCCQEEEESEESSEESEECTEDTDYEETCTGEDTAGTTCEEERCPPPQSPPPQCPPPQCPMDPCFPNPCFPCFPNPFDMMCGMGGGGEGGRNSNVDECGSESGGPYEGQSYMDPSGRGDPYNSQSYRDASGRGDPYNSQSYRDASGRGDPYNSQPYRDPYNRQSYMDPSGRGDPYNSQPYRDPYNRQSYMDPSGRGGAYEGQSYRDPYSRGPEDYNRQSYTSSKIDRSTSNREGPSNLTSQNNTTQGTQWTSATPSRAQTRTTNISVTTGMTPTSSQTQANTMISTTTGITPTQSQTRRSNTKISVTTGMTPTHSYAETGLDSHQHSHKHSHKRSPNHSHNHSGEMENEVCCDSESSGEMVPVYRTNTQTKVSIVEHPNQPSDIFVEQTPVQTMTYEKVKTPRHSMGSHDIGTMADRCSGSGSHKKKHKKKKKKYCYDPCAQPCCPEPHTRRLHRLCSDMEKKRERRLSQIHEPEPELCFEPPPCPIRETKASILRKRPPAKCKHRKQDVPPFHEYCMTNNAYPDVNRYPLLTNDMPPSYFNEEYNETQQACGGTHHQGSHNHQHHQHGCDKVETRGAKRRHHHC